MTIPEPPQENPFRRLIALTSDNGEDLPSIRDAFTARLAAAKLTAPPEQPGDDIFARTDELTERLYPRWQEKPYGFGEDGAHVDLTRTTNIFDWTDMTEGYQRFRNPLYEGEHSLQNAKARETFSSLVDVLSRFEQVSDERRRFRARHQWAIADISGNGWLPGTKEALSRWDQDQLDAVQRSVAVADPLLPKRHTFQTVFVDPASPGHTLANKAPAKSATDAWLQDSLLRRSLPSDAPTTGPGTGQQFGPIGRARSVHARNAWRHASSHRAKAY
ncbi:hypothetical protein HJC99_04650 [Candidatus Saccharibacteria bacterium]|nr:hypothetical protein [Candidatus Saccharibacteria bacterium]